MQSAGFESGDFASIIVNETIIEVAKNENNHYRGIHVVLINPH